MTELNQTKIPLVIHYVSHWPSVSETFAKFDIELSQKFTARILIFTQKIKAKHFFCPSVLNSIYDVKNTFNSRKRKKSTADLIEFLRYIYFSFKLLKYVPKSRLPFIPLKLLQLPFITYASFRFECLIIHIQFLSFESYYIAILVKAIRQLVGKQTKIIFTVHAKDANIDFKDLRLFKVYTDRFICAASKIQIKLLKVIPKNQTTLKYVSSQATIAGLSTNTFFEHIGHVSNPENKYTLLSVGRLVPKKGFSRIPDIVKYMLAYNINFEWLIVGSGVQERFLAQKISDYQLSKFIRLIDSVSSERIYNLMRSCDLYVGLFQDIDGDIDGLPTVLFEAAACRLPILSTSIANIPDVFNQTNSFVINQEDGNSDIAGKIRGLLINPRLLNIKQKSAFDKVNELCNLKSQEQILKSAYFD